MVPFIKTFLALREVPAYVYDRDTVRKCAPPLPFSPPSGGIPLEARRRIIPILTPDTGIPACSVLPGRCGELEEVRVCVLAQCADRRRSADPRRSAAKS